MHTHHKILWSMALLACGSFLTPVKGTPPIEHNLTDYVQAVRGKTGASKTDIAATIEAQKNRLKSEDANDLIAAVDAVQGAVGVVDGVAANDVYTQLTNIDLTDPEHPHLGAIPQINAYESKLAEAIGGVKGLIGDFNGMDIFRQLSNGDPDHLGAIPQINAYESKLAEAIGGVKGVIGNVNGRGDFYRELSETTDGYLGAIPKLNSNAADLATAITTVREAVGKFDGLSPDNVYKQLTNTDPDHLGAIPRLKSGEKVLATAITYVQNAVGVITTDIETTIIQERNKIRSGFSLTGAVSAVQGAVGDITIDIETTIGTQANRLQSGASNLTYGINAVQGAVGGPDGTDVLAKLSSILKKLNAYSPGTTIVITVPEKRFPDLYALYDSIPIPQQGRLSDWQRAQRLEGQW